MYAVLPRPNTIAECAIWRLTAEMPLRGCKVTKKYLLYQNSAIYAQNQAIYAQKQGKLWAKNHWFGITLAYFTVITHCISMR